jgi:hypothetical protein
MLSAFQASMSTMKEKSFIDEYVLTNLGHLSLKKQESMRLVLDNIGVTELADIDDIDPDLVLDCCRRFDLPLLVSSHVRQCFSSVKHHNFAVAVTPGSKAHEEPASSTARRGRKSGILQPQDFMAFREDGTSGAGSPPEDATANSNSTVALSHVGGFSNIRMRSDKFASSGGGPGGLGPGKNIHHPSVKSDAAKAVQEKARAKMATNAITTIPDWCGSPRRWRAFAKHFLRLMTMAGFDIVCRPSYTSVATSLGWSAACIVEGRVFVWEQLHVATIKSKTETR